MNAANAWFSSLEHFAELALDQRAYDYTVARAWVADQIEHNPARIIGEIASMLAGKPGPYPKGYDYRLDDQASVSALRERLCDDVAEQPETLALAERMREEAEEEAAEDAADEVHDRETLTERRACEAERAHRAMTEAMP